MIKRYSMGTYKKRKGDLSLVETCELDELETRFAAREAELKEMCNAVDCGYGPVIRAREILLTLGGCNDCGCCVESITGPKVCNISSNNIVDEYILEDRRPTWCPKVIAATDESGKGVDKDKKKLRNVCGEACEGPYRCMDCNNSDWIPGTRNS